MVAVAAERGVLVPDDLREVLSLGARGLSATQMLRDELAASFQAGRLGDSAEIHLGEDPGNLRCPAEFEQAQLHEVRCAGVPRLRESRICTTGVPVGEVRIEEGALVGREWHEMTVYRSEAVTSLGGLADA